ncbi:hypothetical protein P43SY_009659 [Pythium insidiosum]|uniref:DUSP domain-containing protein n=1 Tax=Pythium insidiosum TaxID=114742 RepID=A0AAD5LAE1_PYTIN|nr:hypothetical protein P43SY_009659 [Pythium insidiosum]
MMRLWSSSKSARDDDDDVDSLELTDLDLESGGSLSLSPASSASPHHALAIGRSLAEERRREERALVLKYDTRELKRGEAWFIIESSWLDAWMAYILSEDDPDCPVVRPGPLTNYSLFDPKEYCLKKGLEATKHYRGVNPMVYSLYAELYGTAGAKPIARWTLDIYATPVMIDDVREMLRAPELKARVEVQELNDRYDVVERPDRSRSEGFLYRCCCRCEYLIPCLGFLLGKGPTYRSEMDDDDDGGARKKRKKRSKRKKKKKKRTYGDDDDDDDDDSSSGEDESETRGLLG